MRKQRNAAFTDEIITEQKEVSADNNNAKTDGTSGLKMKRKNSYFSGYGTENLGSCPAPFTRRDGMSFVQTQRNPSAYRSESRYGRNGCDRSGEQGYL